MNYKGLDELYLNNNVASHHKRISKELCYNQEDLLSFKGYKRAMIRIDDNHWRQAQDDKNKVNMVCTL